MLFEDVNRFKPLYKQFIELKENIQNRNKVFQFKKEKWTKFKESYRQRLKRYRKFKPKDQTRYLVSRHPSRGLSYKTRCKNNLRALKKFRLFHGGLSRPYVKSLTKIAFKNKFRKVNPLFLELFERRLDTVLYRSKFAFSVRNARQLILHGKIFVNNKLIKTKSYVLRPGDTITIPFINFNLIRANIKRSVKWPVPPKHLTINYKILQIIFGVLKRTNPSLNFVYYLDVEKLLNSRHLR
jgi:small subunit ribosomal protein S4